MDGYPELKPKEWYSLLKTKTLKWANVTETTFRLFFSDPIPNDDCFGSLVAKQVVEDAIATMLTCSPLGMQVFALSLYLPQSFC